MYRHTLSFRFKESVDADEREQVLAGSQLAHPMGLGPEARTLAEADVPVVVGRDGYELARLLPTWITQGDGSPVPDEATARA